MGSYAPNVQRSATSVSGAIPPSSYYPTQYAATPDSNASPTYPQPPGSAVGVGPMSQQASPLQLQSQMQSSRDKLHAYIYDYLYKNSLHRAAAAFLKDVPNATLSTRVQDGSAMSSKPSQGLNSSKTKRDYGIGTEEHQKLPSPTRSAASPNGLFEELLHPKSNAFNGQSHQLSSNGSIHGSSNQNQLGQTQPGDEGSTSSDRSSGSTAVSHYGFNSGTNHGTDGDNNSDTSRSESSWSPPGPNSAGKGGEVNPALLPPPTVEYNTRAGHLYTWWSVYSDIFAAVNLQQGSAAARGFLVSRAAAPNGVRVSPFCAYLWFRCLLIFFNLIISLANFVRPVPKTQLKACTPQAHLSVDLV